MNHTKRIKRKLYWLNSNGYIYPTGCKASHLSYTRCEHGRQYGLFECPYCYDGDCDKCNHWGFTNKEYILRPSTNRREGPHVNRHCTDCDGSGYVLCPTLPVTWRGDRSYPCPECCYGRVWYQYNPSTKKWSKH